MSELQRLVNMVPFLNAHPGVSVAQVAEEFGVTQQRVLADLSILQFVGLPGGYYGDLFEVDLGGAREDGHIFARNLDALGRPMRLSTQQAASLIVALRVVRELGGDDAGTRSALAKLESLFADAKVGVDVDLAAGDASVRSCIHDAVEHGQVVRITYRVGGRGAQREAVVEPARLRTDRGFAYLDAWSRARESWRTYRLDRIVDAEMLDEHVPERSVPESLNTWFAEAQTELSITVTNAGRWCADYHPTTACEQVGEYWRITFPLVSQQWGARLLLRLGSDVVEVSDETVAEAARDMAREALGHYGNAA